MGAGSCVVQLNRTERPARYAVGAVVQSSSVMVPSMVECMGRTTSASFSGATGGILIGGDVAPPQRWVEALTSFVGYSAGGGSDGSGINYAFKKTVAFQESASYGVWVAGAGSGGILSRNVGASKWTLRTTSFWGDVSDGGSTDPRRTRARLIVIDGTTAYAAVARSAAPQMGIARSTDSGATWSAWSFGTTRNYTALFKSPQYSAIYASADNRAGGGNDGVFVLNTADASITQLDTIGAGAPNMADVRDVFVVREGTTDCLFVVCGNAAGSDADRGLWRCRINADPTGGGFGSSNVTWTHIYTPGTADRINAVVAYKPNGNGTGPIYVAAIYFSSSTNATGTYTLTPAAGGTVKNYQVRAIRSLNADATTPSFDVISNAANVNINTYGTNHAHLMTYVGEPANENGRFGGSTCAQTDLAIASNGQTLVSAGKSSPWICKNPWSGTPTWRPLAKGLGLLEGAYQNLYVPDKGWSAVVDDDGGLYTWASRALGYIGPAWTVRDDVDGFSGTANASNDVQLDFDGVSFMLARDSDGKAYRISHPVNYNTAVANVYDNATTGSCNGIKPYTWNGTNYYLQVNRNGIFRSKTLVQSITSVATRCDFAQTDDALFLHIADLGIYRSTDGGATWSLWWNYSISNTTTNRFCGHIAASVTTSNLIYAAFDDTGVWRCTAADSSASGSGLSGSRPANTAKIIGGALAGTESISAIAVDSVRGDLWACGYVKDGTAPPNLYRKPPSSDVWVATNDPEYAESCMIPEAMTACDGYLQIGTASQGTLRRMA